MQDKSQIVTMRNSVNEQIAKAKPLLLPMLPKHVNLDQLIGRMNVELMEKPDLLECTPKSLLWSFVRVAELGLSMGDAFGEAYIIPFKDKSGRKQAKFIIGYKGLIRLALQGNMVKAVNAWTIYEKDLFIPRLGSNEVEYEPFLEGHPGKPIAAYSQFILGADKIFKHVVVPMWKLEQIRASSAGSHNPNHPWNTHTDEMYRKTALRAGLKDVPKSNELDRAIATDERAEQDEDAQLYPDVPGFGEDDVSSSRTGSMKERIKAKVAPANGGPPINTDGEPMDEEPPQ